IEHDEGVCEIGAIAQIDLHVAAQSHDDLELVELRASRRLPGRDQQLRRSELEGEAVRIEAVEREATLRVRCRGLSEHRIHVLLRQVRPPDELPSGEDQNTLDGLSGPQDDSTGDAYAVIGSAKFEVCVLRSRWNRWDLRGPHRRPLDTGDAVVRGEEAAEGECPAFARFR